MYSPNTTPFRGFYKYNRASHSHLRSGFHLTVLLLTLLYLAVAPAAKAVSPAPDGGYANANTAEGDGALFNLSSGANNTAIGDSTLSMNTTGNANTAVGSSVLFNLTTGSNNTAVGLTALSGNTTGFSNTAVGVNALKSNTSAFANTAVGVSALLNNTGIANTATGAAALSSNTTGQFNTAEGYGSLGQNTTGSENAANGLNALLENTSGSNNTATGASALLNNTTASENTADGSSALTSNTTGVGNTAAGASALSSNTTGFYNTAHGWHALNRSVTGNSNAALGPSALFANTGSGNAAFGVNSLFHNTTGQGNIAMGYQAGVNLTTGNSNIEIGNFGVAGESLTTRIGASQSRAFIAGVRGAVVSGGTAVYVNASGQLGTNPSSKRFKEDIASMDKKSEAILSLRPVTFRYKEPLDANKTAQFGLIAEEVAEINPDLVTRDEKGETYSVRYEAVNAMLLNEFLKEHHKVQELQAQARAHETDAREQAAIIARQQKQLEALNAGLQKVNERLELSNPAPQLTASQN